MLGGVVLRRRYDVVVGSKPILFIFSDEKAKAARRQ
jgi:hypothetical protein